MPQEIIIKFTHQFFHGVIDEMFTDFFQTITGEDLRASKLYPHVAKGFNRCALAGCKNAHPIKVKAHPLKFIREIVHKANKTERFTFQPNNTLHLMQKRNELFPCPTDSDITIEAKAPNIHCRALRPFRLF